MEIFIYVLGDDGLGNETRRFPDMMHEMVLVAAPGTV
jgi:hypothetical protein